MLLLSDDRQIGISRKIEDRKERDRLRKVGEEIRPTGCSLIIRTEAEGKGKQELSADLKVLTDLQARLMQKAAQARGPALLHQDLTLTYQVIRDAFTEEVNSLVIDAKSVYDNAVELTEMIAPHLRRRIKRYRGKLPIFFKYGIEGEIDRLLRRRVWLRSGGYISIDQAEAFTAIDVNTGRFTGTTGLADTILRTNLEAADEIGRQLRLRDLGGIIVIDFIDMDRPRHRQKVMKAFQDALRKDRQKTNIVHLSPLGLIEMTRKRRGESLMGIITETCPVCVGLGRVRHADDGGAEDRAGRAADCRGGQAAGGDGAGRAEGSRGYRRRDGQSVCAAGQVDGMHGVRAGRRPSRFGGIRHRSDDQCGRAARTRHAG